MSAKRMLPRSGEMASIDHFPKDADPKLISLAWELTRRFRSPDGKTRCVGLHVRSGEDGAILIESGLEKNMIKSTLEKLIGDFRLLCLIKSGVVEIHHYRVLIKPPKRD